jgi:hypothetical protein
MPRSLNTGIDRSHVSTFLAGYGPSLLEVATDENEPAERGGLISLISLFSLFYFAQKGVKGELPG